MRFPTELNINTLRSIQDKIKIKNIMNVSLENLNKILDEHTKNNRYDVILDLGHPVSLQSHKNLW